MALAGLLAIMDDRAEYTLSAAEVRERVTPEEEAALYAAKILASAPRAEGWSCDRGGECAREVQGAHEGADRPLVAVCTRVPPGCPPLALRAEDCARVAFSLPAFVRALRGLTGAGDAEEPAFAGDALYVGRTKERRDVFLALTRAL